MMRYACGYQIVQTQWASLQAYARRELNEGMRWLADELRYEALESMRADDDGMASSGSVLDDEARSARNALMLEWPPEASQASRSRPRE